MTGEATMNTNKTTARTVGVLFLAGMVVYVVGNGLIQSILAAPDHLATVPAKSLLLATGAMLMLMAAAGDAAHGILMLPILKQHSERMAFGYFGSRIVDCVLLTAGIVFLLLQIPLGREYLKAVPDASYLQGLSNVSVQASQYAYQISQIAVGFAGLVLCSMFYKMRLVPQLVAVWGLVGYTALLCGSVLEVLGFDLHLIHTIPGGLWELFIGVWLIAKGFSSAAIVSETAKTEINARQRALSAA